MSANAIQLNMLRDASVSSSSSLSYPSQQPHQCAAYASSATHNSNAPCEPPVSTSHDAIMTSLHWHTSPAIFYNRAHYGCSDSGSGSGSGSGSFLLSGSRRSGVGSSLAFSGSTGGGCLSQSKQKHVSLMPMRHRHKHRDCHTINSNDPTAPSSSASAAAAWSTVAGSMRKSSAIYYTTVHNHSGSFISSLVAM